MIINGTVKATEKKKQSESVKTPLKQMKREIKQRKVDECFEGVKIWDDSHSKSKQKDKRIAEILIVELISFFTKYPHPRECDFKNPHPQMSKI